MRVVVSQLCMKNYSILHFNDCLIKDSLHNLICQMLIFWMIIKTNFHFRDLIRLNLGRNRLDTIPYAALRNLNHLQILEMSDNQISTAAMTPNGFKGN